MNALINKPFVDRTQKFKEIGDFRCIYQKSELAKGLSTWYCLWCIQNVPRRTASNKVLLDKAFEITRNPEYDKYQNGLATMLFKFFDKKSRDTTALKRTGIFLENQ